jgi:hypothetical protein
LVRGVTRRTTRYLIAGHRLLGSGGHSKTLDRWWASSSQRACPRSPNPRYRYHWQAGGLGTCQWISTVAIFKYFDLEPSRQTLAPVSRNARLVTNRVHVRA